MKLNTAAIALVLLLASAAEMCEGGGGGGGASFDVSKYGAKPDGKTDNTKVRKEWKDKIKHVHVDFSWIW